MIHLNSPQLAFAFGILGNIISFMVFLSPMPTFYRIYKKKCTEGFKSMPYSVALFSCTLLLYYGSLKTTGGLMIITINTIGCFIEAIYLTIFLIYAPKLHKAKTTKLLLGLNLVVYGAICATTYFSFHGALRTSIVGWICAIFSVLVFASPLGVMRLVIRTKSVEYMPFGLSLALTVCGTMWFSYGLLIKDYYIAMPNVLGVLLGITQMTIYGIYRNSSKKIQPDDQKAKPSATAVFDVELAANTEADATRKLADNTTLKSPEHVINMAQETTQVEEVVEEIECGDITESVVVGVVAKPRSPPERMVDIHHPIPVAICV